MADHGVRKYDYEMGRFTSCDALAEKYYAVNTYQYSFNNPISLVDVNGKNAVAAVNNTDQVITIKAVYVVENNDHFRYTIGRMQTQINSELNEPNWKVTEGQYSGYKVKFDLKFISEVKGDGMISPSDQNYGNVNIGNYLSSMPLGTTGLCGNIDFIERSGIVNGGVTCNNKEIIMNESYDKIRQRIHEIFHTFFFSNDNGTEGIGNYFPGTDMPNQSDINKTINNSELQKVIE